MISLVNGKRKAAGKGALGWINPSLYQYSALFTKDITSGNNKCTRSTTTSSTSVCCAQGFTAKAGWDPATGLGSVNFTAFSKVFTGLGTAVPTASPTSLKPVARPTATLAPTRRPTVLATSATTGLLYKYTYSQGTTCSATATVISVIAYPVGTCLVNHVLGSNGVYSPSSSVKYTVNTVSGE